MFDVSAGSPLIFIEILPSLRAHLLLTSFALIRVSKVFFHSVLALLCCLLFFLPRFFQPRLHKWHGKQRSRRDTCRLKNCSPFVNLQYSLDVLPNPKISLSLSMQIFMLNNRPKCKFGKGEKEGEASIKNNTIVNNNNHALRR